MANYQDTKALLETAETGQEALKSHLEYLGLSYTTEGEEKGPHEIVCTWDGLETRFHYDEDFLIAVSPALG
jgi:hypothetical protein